MKRLENDGVIESIPYSDWASPIVIVPKADGQVRICGEIKNSINPFIHTEQYPFPNPDELFQKLQGGQLFTELDLKAAYLQMELDDESKMYFVINTPDGLKRNNRMVYGGSSGPAIFQRYLENLLSNVEMTAANQDAVVITENNISHHIYNVKAVLDKFLELGILLNINKCKFFQKTVECVGFILSKDGISTNLRKTKAVLEAPIPKNVTELQSFLGAINYYGHFIPGMSNITAPLYNLLQKGVDCKWADEQEIRL